MTSSTVTLGSSARADLYRGAVTALQGNRVLAKVTRADGHALNLQVDLTVDTNGGTANGTVVARPVTAGG